MYFLDFHGNVQRPRFRQRRQVIADDGVNPVARRLQGRFVATVTDPECGMDEGVIGMTVGDMGPRAAFAAHADAAAGEHAGIDTDIAQLGEQGPGADLVLDIRRIFDDHMRHRFLR